MRKWTLVCLLAMLGVAGSRLVVAQEPPAAASSAAAATPQEKPLTNGDVVAMVKAGLGESTIVLSIQHSATNFDTSPLALVDLKEKGVSTAVLDAMVKAGSAAPAAASQPSASTPANELSPEFRELGLAAVQAIGRMPDIDLPDDGHEARALDAEKALGSAQKKAKTDPDKAALKILIAWWSARTMEYDASENHNMDRFQRASQADNYCLAEAHMIFNPSVLSEKGKQAAAEKKCLSAKEKILGGSQ